MRLDQELVRRKECVSRQEAQECIRLGFVLLDNEIITRATRQVGENSLITVTQTRKFVSRGGDKLEGAIAHKYPHADNTLFNSKVALDIGSSTGGFTDCLLQYGAFKVHAVDVGTLQLHSSLRMDKRVILKENTDIRAFFTKDAFDIIVADVSFISLTKIIDTIISFGKPDSEFFLLIKPQFEVGFGNTKKGIVKDLTLVHDILNNYTKLLTALLYKNITVFPCAIQGGDGNQEYFVYFKK